MPTTSRSIIGLNNGLSEEPAYGAMSIIQKDKNDPAPNTISVLAHPSGNDTMNPPAAPVVAGPGPFGGYYKVTGFAQVGPIKGFTFANDELIIPEDGVYVLPVAWANFRHSANNTTVSLLLGVERDGMIIFSPRPVGNAQASQNKLSNTAGNGQSLVKAGDKLSVWLASDAAGDVTVGNMNVTTHLLDRVPFV